jgi:hypothetical protein
MNAMKPRDYKFSWVAERDEEGRAKKFYGSAGFLADGTLWNPQHHPEDKVRPLVGAGATRLPRRAKLQANNVEKSR